MNELKEISIEDIEKQYKAYAEGECSCALNLVLARIDNLALQYKQEGKTLGATRSRIKDFESTKGKCERKGYPFTIESIRKNIQDIAGIRIITTFQDEIYEIADAIKHTPGLIIDDYEDYYKNPKPSGYTSLHLVVMVEIYYNKSSKLVPVEIQIRDRTAHLWATVEHDARYKVQDNSDGDENKGSSEDFRARRDAAFTNFRNLLKEVSEAAMALRDGKY